LPSACLAEQRVLAEQRRRIADLDERRGEVGCCQNSTMRSVSGWSVTSISSTHQFAQFAALFLDRTGDLQRLAVDARLAFGRSAFGLCGLLAAGAARPDSRPSQPGGGVMASRPHAGQAGGRPRRHSPAPPRRGSRPAVAPNDVARQQMTRLVEIHRRGGRVPASGKPQAGGKVPPHHRRTHADRSLRP